MMSGDYRERIEELRQEAGQRTNTPEAVALIEEAVQLADAAGDAELAYETRDDLVDAATWVGDHDKSLVAFSWCLAESDRRPENSRYQLQNLLWKYKWVISALVHFPDLALSQIESAREDFSRRCQAAGYNQRPALSLRWSIAIRTGRPEEAGCAHAEWEKTTRDGLSDCVACDTNRVASLWRTLGEHEAAMKAAEPILAGRLACAEVPHLTYALLLRSLWNTGRQAEAKAFHERGYRLIRNNATFLSEQAMHVEFLVKANDISRALTLIRRHLPSALATHNLDYQFDFLLAMRSTIRRLLSDGIRSVRIHLPQDEFPFAGKTTAATKAFAESLDERINTLASRFDKRNGNQWFAGLASRVD